MKIDRLPKKLNRFTCWDELYSLLKTKKLILQETTRWKDKNDVEVIKEYARQKDKTVFVKCFCASNETIHHWNSFAKGTNGCCIEFDTKKLLKYVNAIKGELLHGRVQYKYVSDVETTKPPIDSFPFIKRKPYRIEHEYRILWLGTQQETTKEIPIQLDSIIKVTLSPQISRDVFHVKRALLRKLLKQTSKKMKINQSTVLENRRWIKSFRLSGI